MVRAWVRIETETARLAVEFVAECVELRQKGSLNFL